MKRRTAPSECCGHGASERAEKRTSAEAPRHNPRVISASGAGRGFEPLTSSLPLILLAQTRQADRDKANTEADAKHREELSRMQLDMLKQNTAITEQVRPCPSHRPVDPGDPRKGRCLTPLSQS